ncbi:MAG TPA: DUF389 domain-containing protein [Streptosporangiaceae bacterium]
MLHVRVASPAALTPAVVSLVAGDPGVINLVVLPGAARDPDGDAIQFDLATAAANPVLGRLRELQPGGPLGPIAIQAVEAELGAGDLDRPRRGRYHGETEPVWDLVESRIVADSAYAPSFYALLVLAGLIGAVGILTNSTILIVGAMVVGPEYSAIIATALGLDRRDRSAAVRGLIALGAGFGVAILITLLFGLVIRGSGDVPRAYSEGVRPVSDLINSPDLFSVIVAVLAGLVGVVSLTEARAGALIGVFISVTTIPAAADLGLSLAFTSWSAAGGAVAQLLLNVVLLIAVGAVALRLQRRFWRARAGS